MRSRGSVGNSSSNGESSDVSNAGFENGFHVVVSDLEDSGVVKLSVQVDLPDLDQVFVRFNVEFLHKVDFGHGDFRANSQNFSGGNDFQLILDDLSGDFQGLEVLDLGGIHTSGTGGNGDFDGGNGSDFRLLFDDEFGSDIGDFADFFVGEDEQGLDVVD